MRARQPKPTHKRFSFESMKALATSQDRAVRKAVFVEYFEQFHELPSYLFDNEMEIHLDLWQTAQDILEDKSISKEVRRGVENMLTRLPSRPDARR